MLQPPTSRRPIGITGTRVGAAASLRDWLYKARAKIKIRSLASQELDIEFLNSVTHHMERYFSTHMSAGQFLWNVLVFSLFGLIPVLALYVLLSPGFASAMAEGGPLLSRFLRQILTNGLPVVFVVNYVGFFLFALSRQREAKDRDPAAYMAIDFAARLFLFFGLHALIYVVSADLFGSFGGSRTTALQVVAPTLARSALFGNISGVYFYATLVSAVPLYISAIRVSPRFEPVVRFFPDPIGPIAIALLIIASGATCLTVLAIAFMRLQS